ncbi:restriction endonuclease subunit S [Myxococcota bacterium]|nr:restriction endonuclease subunit S [Myxococcota bacterium]
MSLVKKWSEYRLGDLSRIRRGASPRPISNPAWFAEKGPGWIRISDVTKTEGKLTQTEQRLSPEGVKRSVPVHPGQVIMSICATIGEPIEIGIEACIHDGFVVFDQHEHCLDKRFLIHHLRKTQSFFKGQGQTGTQANLNTGIVAQSPIQLPPLAEQRRIAEILDTLDEAIRQTEALLAKLQQMKQGLLHDLLTRGIGADGALRPPHEEVPALYKDSPLGKIPKDWTVGRLEDFLTNLIDYRGKTPNKTNHGIPLITARNVRMGFIDPEPKEYIAASAYTHWMTRGIPSPGDVLFTMEAPLGHAAFFPQEKVALAQRIVTLVPNRSKVADKFLLWLVLWHGSQTRIYRYSTGSTVLGIKQSVLRKILFQFPTIAEGLCISDILAKASCKIEQEQEELQKLRSLKAGLMEDLLTGRVRVPVVEEGEG